MKRILFAAALAAAAAGLSACGTAGAAQLGQALGQMVTDPRCAHHDEAEGITGAAGVPASLHFKVVRDCPAQTPPAGVTPGQVVGATASAAPTISPPAVATAAPPPTS